MTITDDQGRPKAYPATQNESQKSLGDKNKEVGGGAAQFFLGIPQFYFYFSRVDLHLHYVKTILPYKTAQQTHKTRLHRLRMFKLQFCTKFGQMILRKIIKTVATKCHIVRLKCTKFDFGWGSAPDPAGGAHSAPSDPLAGFKGSYF